MRVATRAVAQAIGTAAVMGLALSAIAVRAEGEGAGPPCSATVKDHCMEGASSGRAMMRKHAVRHRKHHMAMANAVPASAKAATAT